MEPFLENRLFGKNLRVGNLQILGHDVLDFFSASRLKKIALVFLMCFSFSIFAQEEGIGQEKAEEYFLTNPVLLQVSSKDLVLKFGGAVRFHYNYIQINSGGPADRSALTGSQFVWDIFALNLAAIYKGFFLNFQYRVNGNFNGGAFPAYGYFGYNFGEHHQLKLGLFAKPFGMPSTYHGWANTAINFIGLEDGGGMSFNYALNYDHYELDVTFTKNSFPRALSEDFRRFYYNTAGDDEDNQVDLRFMYHFDRNKNSNIGFSVEVGGLYNNRKNNGSIIDPELDPYGYYLYDYVLRSDNPKHHKYGTKWAVAIHGEHDILPELNLRAEYGYYDFTPNDRPRAYAIGTDDNGVTTFEDTGYEALAMAGFGDAFLVYPRGHFGFIGAEYKFVINKSVLESVSIFNDFSFLTKGNSWDSKTTLTNTLGMIIMMGPVMIRPEWMAGQNHLWFNSDFEGVLVKGNPVSSHWDHRFNIHIGFYF